MYKVFANEKLFSLNNTSILGCENLLYEGHSHIFEVALDLLFNSKETHVNIYAKDVDLLWESFYNFLPLIIAAGGVVKDTKNKILLIKRLDKWDLPKGKAEKGESIEETSVREVEEECSLKKVIINNFLKKTYHIYKDKKIYILKETYWYSMCIPDEQIAQPQLEEGITEAEWKNIDEVNVLLEGSYKNIKELINYYISIQ